MRVLKARLSDQACEGWEKWAARHAVTLSALLEAIGQDLAKEAWDRPLEKMHPPVRATVERARQIQLERRKRR